MASQGPKSGRNCYVTACVLGDPHEGDEIKIGYITPAFSGAQKWAELLCNPLRSRRSPEAGTKSKLATSPLPSPGPTSGRNCYVTACVLGDPREGDEIKIGYITPAFSGAQKWAESLCNPCVPGGPPKR